MLEGSCLCLFYRDTEAETFTEQLKPGFMSTTPSNGLVSTARPPSAPAPAVPPVSVAAVDPAHFKQVSPQKPQLGPGDLGKSLLYIGIRFLKLDICLLVESVCCSLHVKAPWSELTTTLSSVN